MNFVRCFLVLALGLPWAGCGTGGKPTGTRPLPPALAGTPGPTRGGTIAPGEVLEIYVMEDDALSGRYQVRASGHVILPGAGRVMVAGLTSAAAEEAVRRGLQANQLKTATVMVERASGAAAPAGETLSVFFGGSVLTPGRRQVAYVAGRKPTLYQGILEAGGLSRFADARKVTLGRRGGDGRNQVTTVNLDKVRDGSLVDVTLEDGDIVNVPEKGFGW